MTRPRLRKCVAIENNMNLLTIIWESLKEILNLSLVIHFSFDWLGMISLSLNLLAACLKHVFHSIGIFRELLMPVTCLICTPNFLSTADIIENSFHKLIWVKVNRKEIIILEYWISVILFHGLATYHNLLSVRRKLLAVLEGVIISVRPI